MSVNLIEDLNRGVSIASPVCSLCRHRSGYRRCAAFLDGIPLDIWLGRDTHQGPYPDDHGIQFEPVPGAKVTTPQVTEGDKVLWPLIDEERAREPQAVSWRVATAGVQKPPSPGGRSLIG